MFGERERSIKNMVVDALGGPESYRQARRQTDEIDETYVEIENRRSSVVVRRLAIFVVLYVLIVLTAVAVVRGTDRTFGCRSLGGRRDVQRGKRRHLLCTVSEAAICAPGAGRVCVRRTQA